MSIKRLHIFQSYFDWKLCLKIMFENKTIILEINNTKKLFIKSVFLKQVCKLATQYFLVTYNTHYRILNALITKLCLAFSPGGFYWFESPGHWRPSTQAIPALAGLSSLLGAWGAPIGEYRRIKHFCTYHTCLNSCAAPTLK